jgi:hypothetical protein
MHIHQAVLNLPMAIANVRDREEILLIEGCFLYWMIRLHSYRFDHSSPSRNR